MANHRRINAREFVDDFRSRMSDAQLMGKYGLTSERLKGVFVRLVGAGAIRREELEERSPYYNDPSKRVKTRRYARVSVSVPLPAFELDKPKRKALVRDMSEKGLRLAGFRESIGKVGEVRHLVIPAGTFVNADAIQMTAECRWIKKSGTGREYYIAGFEIVSISRDGQEKLARLMDQLYLSETASVDLQDLPTAELIAENDYLYEQYHQDSEQEALKQPAVLGQNAVAPISVRRVPRYKPQFRILVYDLRDTSFSGQVRDISERGLQVAGIPTKVLEEKRLLIQTNKLSDLQPVSFDAECRWAKTETERNLCLAGFEITRISSEGFCELQKLIECVSSRE